MLQIVLQGSFHKKRCLAWTLANGPERNPSTECIASSSPPNTTVHFENVSCDCIWVWTKPIKNLKQFMLNNGPRHKKIVERIDRWTGLRSIENYANFCGGAIFLYDAMMSQEVDLETSFFYFFLCYILTVSVSNPILINLTPALNVTLSMADRYELACRFNPLKNNKNIHRFGFSKKFA